LEAVRRDLATGTLCVRWHHLKAFGRSLAQGYAALTGAAPEKKSAAIESGDAVDSEILDGLDGKVIAVPEGMRRDRRVKAYQEFEAANPGKIILTGAEHERVMKMTDSVLCHNDASTLLLSKGVERKKALRWQREDGIWCQGTPDACQPGEFIADLKRCTEAVLPRRFSEHANRMGWTGQLAFYHEAVTAQHGGEHDVYFVVVEAEPSLGNRMHEVAVFRMTPQVHEEGQRMLEDYWALLLRFLEDGDISGYGGGEVIDMEPRYIREIGARP